MQPQQPQQTREQFIENLFVIQKKDNFLIGKKSRKPIVAGINKGFEAVSGAYGPGGSNGIIAAFENPKHRHSNDGKVILDSMILGDKFEAIGLNHMKECANNADKNSGGGRKTSAILLGAIVNEGIKHEYIPMELKLSFEDCLPIIQEEIDKATKKVTVDEIEQVATAASENKKLGAVFQEIYKKIGKEGIIEIDNSGLSETFYTTTEGVRLLNCGLMWPYMANEDKGRQAVYKFPKVLIVKQKLTHISQLDNVFRDLSSNGVNELVIFCDEIDLSVSQQLFLIHNGQTENGQPRVTFKALVIKAPVLWKDWLFEDFAKITKATIIDPAQGRTLKHFQYSWLGYCDKITTTKEETIVLGIQDIKDHLENLKDMNTDDAKIRIARLQTKTAILKLGANSETELSHLRGKATDARNESYLALNSGVVPGAGQTFERIAKKMPDTIAGKILAKAFLVPSQVLKENMGTHKLDKNTVDAAIVVKNSVTNAVSIASSILSTNFLSDPITP